MFEHMAFKGTNTIGTRNYAAESVALKKVDATYAPTRPTKRKDHGTRRSKSRPCLKKPGSRPSPKPTNTWSITSSARSSKARAEKASTPLPISTRPPTTTLFPRTASSCGAWLESERFLHPVMRQFYKERDVVFEERRSSTDSNPQGRLIEQFLSRRLHRPPLRTTRHRLAL